MKKILLLLFLPLTAFSQSVTSFFNFSNNQSGGNVTNGGYLFYNPADGSTSYHVNDIDYEDNNPSPLFISSILSMSTVDGVLQGVGQTYGGEELAPGPIANNYTLQSYMNKYVYYIHTISDSLIQEHIANWESPSYTIPFEILEWPCNGDLSNGEAEILAPFKDLNENHIYEPEQGEYPLIRGDFASYVIMNDVWCEHSSSQLPQAKQEIHMMVYQYKESDVMLTPALAQTTFVSFKVYNRSSVPYENYQFGLFNDYDLGGPLDDYTGTDTSLSLSYIYNADNYDDSIIGANGYYENPPAFGCMELNNLMSSNVLHDALNDGVELNYNLKGYKSNGEPFIDSEGNSTKFAYNDEITNNSEMDLMNPPGDRKVVIGTPSTSLLPNQYICRDFAFVYARDTSLSNTENLELLKTNALSIKNFYDAQDFNCNPMSSAEIESINEIDKIIVFPNPANDKLTILTESELNFEVYASDGRLLIKGMTNNKSIQIEDLSTGRYFLKIFNENEISTISFQKN
jgi:hypothetical protein